MNMHWSSEKAFGRNLGLISFQEQQRLSESLVVIPGCGGIGSTVAETLARLGVGRFRLCDPDCFDIANFNRQVGATAESLSLNKAEATRSRILSINPSALVDVITAPLASDNAEAFVRGADVVLDGIDFFVLGARRALFSAANRLDIPAMTAAPLGFSATLQVYLPSRGMSFDEFFDFSESDNSGIQLMKFLVGLAPKALHRSYMDLSKINAGEKSGPSSIIGTQLAATLIGGEVLRLILNRGGTLPAPWYRQFDAYRQIWVKKRLHGGNRHPYQRVKIQLAKRGFQKNGLWEDLCRLNLA
jgi:molybdopterin/thiamine biosynthesis adenylyltransferase